MKNRILQHIAFWLFFVLLNVVVNLFFPAESDLVYSPFVRFFRFFFSEIVFLPWKIIPFYFIFYYLIPKYLQKKEHGKIILFSLLAMVICAYGYRSTMTPVSTILYGEPPSFGVYSFKRVLYTLIEFIPIVGLASAVKLLRGRIATQRKVQALQDEKLATELNFLKAQTNPHFLFNTLNNLYGLARKNNQNTAPSIMKLANIMRYILKECSSPTIAVEKEIKIIEDYIALEQLRYDDRLKIRFEKEVDDNQQAIAPLILLPFVENAFKHGTSETRFETSIDISLKLEEGVLYFQIANTKDDQETPLERGTGLNNVIRQLELIYGEKAILEIVPTHHQFLVKLTIHLQYAKTHLLNH